MVTGSLNLGGPIATAGGLVFTAAAMDNRLRAFDADTGQELWAFELPAGGQATPMTYSIDDTQYLVIAAGGHGKIGTKLGDYVRRVSFGWGPRNGPQAPRRSPRPGKAVTQVLTLRQPQHAFAEDVALDLAGAGGDRVLARRTSRLNQRGASGTSSLLSFTSACMPSSSPAASAMRTPSSEPDSLRIEPSGPGASPRIWRVSARKRVYFIASQSM
jgi:hypothetical protein